MKKLVVLLSLLLSVTLFAKTTKVPNISGPNQYNQVETIEKYKGKFTVLVFWTSWCHTCQEEIPVINKLYKEFGENEKDVVFLGINNEDQDVVVKFLDENNYSLPTLFNKNGVKEFGVRAFPTMIFLDKDGKIINSAAGAIPEETLKKYIQTKLLKKSI